MKKRVRRIKKRRLKEETLIAIPVLTALHKLEPKERMSEIKTHLQQLRDLPFNQRLNELDNLRKDIVRATKQGHLTKKEHYEARKGISDEKVKALRSESRYLRQREAELEERELILRARQLNLELKKLHKEAQGEPRTRVDIQKEIDLLEQQKDVVKQIIEKRKTKEKRK